MQNKKRKELFKRPAKKHNSRKKLLFWLSTLFIIIVGAIIVWRTFTYNENITQITTNITIPSPSNFTDNNNMVFSEQSDIPDVNNNREITMPANITISFGIDAGSYAPALKPNLTAEDLSNEIKITPFVKGKWQSPNNDVLIFTPAQQWPANTKFTVKMDSNLFNEDVKIDNNRLSFTTPPITATVDNFNLYPAPAAPQSVIGVAVISFDYEIDTTDFNKKLSLKLDDRKLNFSVKFDRYHRTAFIISDPIKVTESPQIIRLKLNRVPAFNGDSKTKKITASLTIDSVDNIFKISSIETIVADDGDGNAQQLILLNTTSAAKNEKDLSQYITAYLLPTFIDDEEKESDTVHLWKQDEITDKTLSESKKLTLNPMNFNSPNGVYQYAFSYDVQNEKPQYIYINLKPGAESKNGFLMNNGASTILKVPYPEKTVTIAGAGAILSLAGEQKLGIVAKGGVDTAYINLYKVKSEEINHLISQTYNVFAKNMEFKSWSFGVYDMSVIFQKKISFANSSIKKPNYASIDLGSYLDRTYDDNTGIFIIQAGTTANEAEYNDKRLILLTDLGIIRKVNLDGTSSIFVSHLSDGTPAASVEISVLGRNGNAIWAGQTDETGAVNIPNLPWSEYKNAKEPVAIVARQNNDVSFIPYNAYNQQVEYSKFDIDGIYSYSSSPLNAFIFSDRGIYRPDEKLILGGIVKNKSFKSLAGIPVKLQIIDSRGRHVLEKNFSLTADGMFDIEYTIPSDANLGNWTAYLYSLNSNDKLKDMLGSANFDVQEFVPDTLKIQANILGGSKSGWISPNNIKAQISLRNLFGTPASNRKISTTAKLTPIEYTFDDFINYTFTPNFISDTGLSINTARRSQTYSIDIPDVKTDENGIANINVEINKNIPSGTYLLTMNVRGFEANSGKSVQTNITTRISDAKYLVGWRASADLKYINKNSTRKINLISIDHTATPITTEGLKLRIIKRENQTSLVKDYNNYYKYQTIYNDKIISEKNLTIPATGKEISLDTDTSGTYFMQVLDAADKILVNAEYYIAGDTNTSMNVDTPAEMEIKLDKAEYKPGDEISINIKSPYTGTGLITIERDKVYAYKWFKTEKASSIQKITIPDNFEGTGYINVSFVRDINSKDIFTSPYAYAIAPFSADISKHKIDIKLNTPKIIDKHQLTIQYTTNKNARVMIFAVNEGVLQVARYKLPQPLSYFFQKSALQVSTYQILSLLLPEYKILQEYAKTGGGDYGSDTEENQIRTNPFSTKNLPPVAFYSGIIDAKANETGKIVFDIPDYFNGSLQVYAVATNTDSIGSGNTEVLVQSPVVISTSTPVAVAPGDTFKINSVVTNMMTTSKANVKISASSNGGVKIESPATQTQAISGGKEQLFTFDAKATNDLGNADINIVVNLSSDNNEKSAKKTNQSKISVRPASAYITDIRLDNITSKHTKISDFKKDMYPEYLTQKLYISKGASALIMPLFKYLSAYEYPCTEQIVSQAVPYVIMPNDALLGTEYEKSSKKIENVLNQLKNRQNDDGSFSLWSGNSNDRNNEYDIEAANLTAYVVQFLTMAQNEGFVIPKEMLSRGIDFLRTFASGNIINEEYAKAVAYSIYVISENGYVTTSYIDAFSQYANANIKNWEKTLMGVYIATAYKLMKQEDLANDMINKYTPSNNSRFEYKDLFDNSVANDAMYYYLSKKYFSQNDVLTSKQINAYLQAGNYSSYTSALAIMALSGASSQSSDELPYIEIITNEDTKLTIQKYESEIIVDIPKNTTELSIICNECDKKAPLYYTLLQQGYPTTTKEASNGIEITREYYNVDGEKVTSGNIGDIITVKIFARTRNKVDVAGNVVITDLLPGGFIPDTESVKGASEFIEVRDDRVLIFTPLTREGQQFTYTAQLGTIGEFKIPAITATSMYNPQINATGTTGTFKVSNETLVK